MQKKASLLIGVTLIVLGILALAGNLLIRAVGGGFMLGFRAWPIFVVGAGLLFCLPPFLFPQQRGLSGLFVPGIPTLITGMLLFVASVTGYWAIWAILWPLEVLSVAAAFVLMAIFLKVPWLMIPASIIGFTGLVLQFCAATGWWSSWAVLWTVEPFAVGLPLLLIGLVQENRRRQTGRHHPVRPGRAGLRRHVHRPGDLAVDHPPDRAGAGAGAGRPPGGFGAGEAFA